MNTLDLKQINILPQSGRSFGKQYHMDVIFELKKNFHNKGGTIEEFTETYTAAKKMAPSSYGSFIQMLKILLQKLLDDKYKASMKLLELEKIEMAKRKFVNRGWIGHAVKRKR